MCQREGRARGGGGGRVCHFVIKANLVTEFAREKQNTESIIPYLS